MIDAKKARPGSESSEDDDKASGDEEEMDGDAYVAETFSLRDIGLHLMMEVRRSFFRSCS